SSIDIVDEAENGKEVLDTIKTTEPEIIIMDMDMPVMDGIEATRYISIHYPQISVIVISINDEQPNFKKAMMAGAKAYLVKPLSPNELNNTVREVAELNRTCQQVQNKSNNSIIEPNIDTASQNQLIIVFGTKGGVGKSVLCTNLAVAAAQKYGQKVALVDLDIQFGDVSIMMNLNPRRTLSELIQEDEISNDIFEDYLYERYGVNILAAPNKPELAELVTPSGVGKILETMKKNYKYTFIDSPSFIDEIVLTALEKADKILLVSTLDLPTIKNVKKGIDILKSLSLLPKAKLILNRSSGAVGIEPLDMERALDMKIQANVPSDGKLIIASLNRGVPVVKLNSRAPIAKSLVDLLQILN
ncbi:MAG TPA: response regulator, partial [Syntrophomonadaceae bacterium]|nr:response regulator [Syntrophomonadaceae bacterium]